MMHVYRRVRRRVREARSLEEPAGPRQWARWTWEAITYDLRVLADVLNGRG
jgi:hypothetical protein